MNRLLVALLFLSWLAACRSSRPTPPLPKPAETSLSPSRVPTLLVQPSGDTLRQPLRLAAMSVELEALVGAVRVSLELTYENRYDEELAGTFFFPLANGLTVDSFALAVNGRLRAGVIVPRERGRQVYEQVKREGIDPALLEWQRGHAFRAQVYPIPAGGRKRIQLAFTAPMQYQNGLWSYRLPLRTENTLAELRVKTHLPQAEAATLILEPEQAMAPYLLPLPKHRSGFRIDTTLRDFLVNHQLALSYQPRKATRDAPEQLLYTDEAGNTWFAAQVQMPAPTREVPPPQRIALLWDVSHSAAKRALPQEKAILAAYLAELGEVEVLLLPFRHRPLPVERFQIRGGDGTALWARLSHFRYDGATHLAALPLAELEVDEVILASDGVATWQGLRLPPGAHRLHALTSSPQADLTYLQALTRQQGGVLIQANEGTRSPKAWASMLRQSQTSVRVRASRSEINPLLRPQPDQPWLITGRLRGERDTLRLWDAQGTSRQIYLDRSKQGQASDLPRRLWAQQRLVSLLAAAQARPDDIVALAQTHGLITPFTSLLVLDRVEDYLRFEVAPPPELAQAVAEARARKQKETQFQMMSHLDQVAEGFALRVDWWETDFDWPTEPYQAPKPERSTQADGGGVEPAQESSSLDVFGESEGRLEASDAGFEDPPARAEEPGAPPSAKDEDAAIAPPTVSIELERWTSALPYQSRLEEVALDSLEAVYFQLKASYGKLPAFYADAARVCEMRGQPELGLRILSNLAELSPDYVPTLRVLGYRLQQLDSLALAAWVWREVLRLRPDEPQSHRDLGLVLARQGSLQAAVERLYEVVRQPWDERFPEIGVLVAHEINSLIGETRQPLDLSFVDERLLKAMPTDLRVVLSWDANDVDLDLWVIDPRGEKCYYQNRQTQIGGLMSRDFTGGYGPEEFLLKAAMPGRYQVKANYYANKQASFTGPATLRLRLIRNYGRPDQEEKRIVLRLGEENEVVSVGQFEVEK